MKSMTGFGGGRAESQTIGTLAVELRSVNNRFLDLGIRLPQEMTSLEPEIRAEMQKHFARGKIYIDTRFHPIPGSTQRYELNQSLVEKLEQFCKDRGQQPTPSEFLSVPGVVVVTPDAGCQEELKDLLLRALSDAIKAMHVDREREGEVLRQALHQICKQMAQCLAQIEAARPLVVEKYRARLEERLEDLMGPKKGMLDPGRLEQEVALFADKADILEETTRLKAHLDRLEELLSPGNDEARGRPLDFLNQEILREINTIGSKARDIDITRQVLELKNLAENLKEQIANIE